jgi:hypothetical protein
LSFFSSAFFSPLIDVIFKYNSDAKLLISLGLTLRTESSFFEKRIRDSNIVLFPELFSPTIVVMPIFLFFYCGTAKLIIFSSAKPL